MFDLNEFIARCQAALTEHSPQLAIKDILERVTAEPGAVEAALGTPTSATIDVLHRAPDLTVLKAIWAPGMAISPHDHRMWAVIGVYGGQEDNVFYRRSPEGLSQAGSKVLQARDCVLLGDKVIHAVTNPRRTYTGAIHVYGGDFVGQARSEWDPETLEERAFDFDKARRYFILANDRGLAEQASHAAC